MPLRILLDSNFLFIPVQFRIDVLQELEKIINRKVEAILLRQVYDELRKISMRKRNGRDAKMALKYVDKLTIVDIEAKPSETVDDLIFRLATEWKCPVATNDRKFRKRLREMNIATIYLRGRSHLVIEGNLTIG